MIASDELFADIVIGCWCTIHRAEAWCQGLDPERARQGCLDVKDHEWRDEEAVVMVMIW